MRELKKLIKELCPDGVEYKKLSEITNLTAGERITKAMMSDDMQYPVYGGGVSPTGMYDKFNFHHAITISRAGSAGHVNWVENKFWATDVCFVATQKTNDVNIKFVYYVVKNLQPKLQQNIYGGNLPKLNKDFLWSLPIPVPPIQIQEKIVSILDKMSELAAELAAELAMRKGQYTCYRDNCLYFENNIPMLKLGEICETIKDGMHNLPQNSSESGQIPILSAANIYNGTIDYNAKRYVEKTVFEKENKRTNIEVGDVLLTIVATIGRTAVVEANSQFLLQRSVCALKPTNKILPKFLKYCLDTKDVQEYMFRNAHGSAQAGLYLKQVAEIKVPCPPIETQKQIVEIIDKFNNICNSISTGLPAEIELRQKQYEYYRNKLLAFKELEKEDTNE